MGLLFVVTQSGSLASQRKQFESIMGTTVQLVNEQTSCDQSIAESLSELKVNLLFLSICTSNFRNSIYVTQTKLIYSPLDVDISMQMCRGVENRNILVASDQI